MYVILEHKDEDGNVVSAAGTPSTARAINPEIVENAEWRYAHVAHRINQNTPEVHRQVLDEPHIILYEYLGDTVDLEVPAELDGLPVCEMAANSCVGNTQLESVFIPDSVVRIGTKAFALCTRLRKVRLSDSLVELDDSLFLRCGLLRELHLPTALETLSYRLLSNCRIDCLVLPAKLKNINWENADYGSIFRIELAEGNERFTTDGYGLYSTDGSELIRMLVAVEDYKLPAGCRRIGDNAFKTMLSLRHIEFNDELKEIGAYAFFRTAVREMNFPKSLRRIERRAFFQCSSLESAELPDSVVHIGAYAFSRSGLKSLYLPASVRELGIGAFAGAKLIGPSGAALEIDPESPYLFTDGKALYTRNPDGLHLHSVLVVDNEFEPYPGTVAIEDEALSRCENLKRLRVTEGIVSIGNRACYATASLEEVELPDSLESIGEQAFSGTSIDHVRLGPRLAHIGAEAFCSAEGDSRAEADLLSSIELDSENEHYYIEQNLLIERGDDGDTAILYFGNAETVVIPEAVHYIAGRAFQFSAVRELYVHANIKQVAQSSFYDLKRLSRVHIELPEEINGFKSVVVEFPGVRSGSGGIERCMHMAPEHHFFRFSNYDSWIRAYWLMNARDVRALSRMIQSRVEQPVELTKKARSGLTDCMNSILEALVCDLARNRNFGEYERLLENGFINEENIDRVLRAVEGCGEAEATGFLLDAKKRRFGIGGHDFSL